MPKNPLKAVGGLFGAGFSGTPAETNYYKVPGADAIGRAATEGLFRSSGIGGDIGSYLSGKGGELDFSGLGAGPSEAEYAGIQQKLDPLRGALEGTQKPILFADSYKPTSYDPAQFNFEGLPKKFGDIAYQRGAERLTDTFGDQMRSTRESLGTRRPDLLFKAEESGQRQLGRQLGDLGLGIAQDVMGKETDLAVQQQLQQAAENMGAAQFGEGQQQFGAGLQQAQSMAQNQQAQDYFSGLGKILGIETGLEDALKGEKQANLDKLIDLFTKTQQLQAGTYSYKPATPSPFGENFGGTLGSLAAKGVGSLF